MFDFLEHIKYFLPLHLENIQYDGDTLIITGEKWRLASSSIWRVSNDKELLFTCWDNNSTKMIKNLLGLSIISVAWMLDKQKIDPSFLLSDGKRLDVFCAYSYEPWIISLPDGNIYIGNS